MGNINFYLQRCQQPQSFSAFLSVCFHFPQNKLHLADVDSVDYFHWCFLVVWNFNFMCGLKEVGLLLLLSLSLSLPFLPFLFSFLCQIGAELSFAITILEPLVCKGPQGQLSYHITLYSSVSLYSWFPGFAVSVSVLFPPSISDLSAVCTWSKPWGANTILTGSLSIRPSLIISKFL